MRIVYSPTFSDYWSLNSYVLFKQFRIVALFAGALLVLFLIFPMLPYTAHQNHDLLERYRASSGLLILPGIIAFIFAATYWGAKKRWAAAQELREEREYIFDDSGISVKTKTANSFTNWEIFTEAVVTKKFIFLSTAQRQFHYFPILAVPDLPRLRELLKEKVARVNVSYTNR